MARPTRPGTSRSRAARSIVPERSRMHGGAVLLRTFLHRVVQFATLDGYSAKDLVSGVLGVLSLRVHGQRRELSVAVVGNPPLDQVAAIVAPTTKADGTAAIAEDRDRPRWVRGWKE